MKENWKYKKMSDVFDLQMGKTPSRDNSDYWNGSETWVSIGDMGDGKYISSSKEHITNLAINESGIKATPSGCVIMSFKLSVGKVGITTKSLYTNEAIMSFIPKEEYSISNDYIYYYLKGYNWGNTNRAVMGITLNKTSISNGVILIPPLPVQQQIVAELDLLSDIIEKQKQQIAELDKLAQATFYDMFGDPVTNEKGWEVKKLGEVAIEKLSYGSGASAIDYDGKLRYVRITDICDSGELNDDFKSPSSYDERYLLNDGDILFARSGATVGKTYCHNSKNGQCIYAGYLIRMIPDRRLVLPEYIFQYTKSEFYNSFIRKSQNAVAQPNINAKQYSDLTVLLPPLPLQRSFASRIEAIERQKELISNSIKESQKLFDSRMEYWFG